MAKKISKKKLINALIIVAAVAALAAGLAAVSRMRAAMALPETEVETRLVQGAAERADIARTLSAGAVISDAGASEVSLAGDIALEKWAVKNGDFVTEGQLLATVDKTSVLAAAEELNTLMRKLDSAIESARYDTLSTALRAARDGRVKAVYAAAGDSVSEVVAEHGALMSLSLDGRMAVDIASPKLTLGAGVSVVTESAGTLAGVVLSVTEGVATVTVSDEAALPGESVAVCVGDEKIGEGELYIHNELKLTGFAGTVAAVNAAVNAPVSAGNNLITLANTEYSGNYETLLTKRHELEQDMQRLIAAYERGGVYAEVSGRVSNIDESLADTDDALSAGSLTAAAPVGTKSDEGEGGNVPAAGGDDPTAPDEDGKGETTVTELIGRVNELKKDDAGVTTLVLTLSGEAAGKHEVTLAELEGKTGAVKPDEIKPGDILSLRYENGVLVSATVYQSDSGGEAAAPGQDSGSAMPSGGGSAAGGTGGMAAAGGGMGGTATASAQGADAEDYSVEKTTLCTLTPYNETKLELSVDELDVRLLHVGMELSVTLDALPGRSFAATITEINPVGENNGGSTKYTVTATMAREEDMLAGMNAAVYAVLEERAGALTVPTAALNEDAEGVFVYTSYDKKEDTLGGAKYVTTGLSDGERTEILSGLDEGAAYYYRYADSIKYGFK